ncbi:hypothetical protein C7451_104158 [Blastomonas natatoria]|uniref:DUF2271 domain-containing protein n=1 Tax=Blastomonas natatoria TaxID=34015 RepID=A0A2V3V7B0_9SPHN|nr:DUF2271 domain-containing protein [Blastomonas natatoria]PXW77663.1 hypothetical protein C7451_104158 [Blastomonas natatoria]
MKTSIAIAVSMVAAPATAGTVTVTIPRINVAEYHVPYVAVWIEPKAGGPARTLAVWYDVDKRGNEPGTKWLADLRTWWRKGGRSLNLPADGVSGATRAPGAHRIAIPANVKPGEYTLFVEAAREEGGRELVSVPLSIPARAGKASGKTELGAVTVTAR